MARRVLGLSDVHQETLNRLDDELRRVDRRNMRRRRYFEGKHVLDKLPPTLPGYLRSTALVLGWPAKAVEMLHRRCRMEEIVSTGGDLDEVGLSWLLDANRYMEEARLGELDALIYGPGFEVVTRGGVGEPDAVVSQVSARTGTGDWNRRARRLDSFLSVVARDDDGEIRDANLYLPDVTIQIKDRDVVDQRPQRLGYVPVEPIPYRPTLENPFGSSRISRAVMSLTDSAVRTALRSEGTADVYGWPGMVVFGPDSEAFEKSGVEMLIDRMLAIPDNPDEDRGNLARAQVQQLQQGNQTPHVEQLQVWAGLFAGETNIPVSSLGVGLSQANPTSEGSYIASREDLIAEAEEATTTWAAAHARTLRTLWREASGEHTGLVPDAVAQVRPRYRDPRYLSQSAKADASMKLVSVFPWLAESDAFFETLGYDPATTERMLADKQRARGRALLDQFRSAPAEVNDGDTADDQ